MFSPDDLLFLVPEESLASRVQGGFARRVLILLATGARPADDRAFLARVFLAAQLDLTRDTLVAEVDPNERVALLPLLKEKQPEVVLVFGLQPAQCGLTLDLAPYQPVTFYQTRLLFADAPALLEPDKTRKGLLWGAMKELLFL